MLVSNRVIVVVKVKLFIICPFVFVSKVLMCMSINIFNLYVLNFFLFFCVVWFVFSSILGRCAGVSPRFTFFSSKIFLQQMGNGSSIQCPVLWKPTEQYVRWSDEHEKIMLNKKELTSAMSGGFRSWIQSWKGFTVRRRRSNTYTHSH